MGVHVVGVPARRGMGIVCASVNTEHTGSNLAYVKHPGFQATARSFDVCRVENQSSVKRELLIASASCCVIIW
jgi:hypothetical protein